MSVPLCAVFSIVAVLIGLAALAPDAKAGPYNDNFADAVPFQSAPGGISATNKNATSEPNESVHGVGATASVWYRWTATWSGVAVVSGCDSYVEDGGEIDAIGVYTGDSLESLVRLSSGHCDAAVRVTEGVTYRIAAAGYPEYSGRFMLWIRSAQMVANDDFADAIPVTGSSFSGDTKNSSFELGEPDYGEELGYENGSLWYSWTAEESGVVIFNGCDDDDAYVEGIAVFSGDSLGSLTPVASGYCRAGIKAEAGTTYRIAILGWSRYSGKFKVTLSQPQPPANDDFAQARTVNGNSVSVDATTAGATSEPGEPDHGDERAEGTVWFNWTPSSSGTAEVYTCGDGVDRIAAYTGDSLASLQTRGSGYCSASFRVVAGTTYRIAAAVRIADGSPFSLRFRVLAPPSNDDFVNALSVSELPVNGNTRGASREDGEPLHGGVDAPATVWFRISFADTATYRLNACYSEYGTAAIAVYAGDSLSNLDLLGQGDCAAVVDLKAGEVYRVAVTSYTEDWGSFTLNGIRYATPSNDDFENATVLPGTIISVGNSYLYSATRQPGEPTHHGDGNRSVWYSWTAPEYGDMTFTLCAPFDPVFAVYEGSRLEDLAEVASAGGGQIDACPSYGSEVTFRAQPGKTYTLAVDGRTPAVLGLFSIKSSFTPRVSHYALDVHLTGTGHGRVLSTPAGTDCDDLCSSYFPVDSEVTLRAIPDEGSRFEGWSGYCEGLDECTLTMDQAYRVVAVFSEIPTPPVKHEVRIRVIGDGTGKVIDDGNALSCAGDCAWTFEEGHWFSFQPVADQGSYFYKWQGCGESNDCSFQLNQGVTMVAIFRRKQQDPDPVPVLHPKLAIPTVKPTTLKIRAGKSKGALLRVVSTGDADVEDVKVCAFVPKRFRNMIKTFGCRTLGTFNPGAAVSQGFRIYATRKARSRATIKFVVSSANAAPVYGYLTVKIKAKRKRR